MKGASAAVLTFLILGIGIVGCDPMVLNEGDQVNSDVSGTWSYVDTSGARSTWTLTQTEDATVEGTGTSSDTISGFVNGDSVVLTVKYATVTYVTNLTTRVNGTVTDNGTMSGTFTNSALAGGAWAAYRTM